jgi:hypothetical protein
MTVITSAREFVERMNDRLNNRGKNEFIERICTKCMDRVVKDLNRIADARLLEGSINGKLSFTHRKVEDTVYAVVPSDPVLFKKLEWGEFNEDGSLKTPPHSVLQELKVYVRL